DRRRTVPQPARPGRRRPDHGPGRGAAGARAPRCPPVGMAGPGSSDVGQPAGGKSGGSRGPRVRARRTRPGGVRRGHRRGDRRGVRGARRPARRAARGRGLRAGGKRRVGGRHRPRRPVLPGCVRWHRGRPGAGLEVDRHPVGPRPGRRDVRERAPGGAGRRAALRCRGCGSRAGRRHGAAVHPGPQVRLVHRRGAPDARHVGVPGGAGLRPGRAAAGRAGPAALRDRRAGERGAGRRSGPGAGRRSPPGLPQRPPHDRWLPGPGRGRLLRRGALRAAATRRRGQVPLAV
ncbi:MAG: Allophanate hydrolase 2 subunit 2, partial [uncultured Nocardioidaceae bacterium]